MDAHDPTAAAREAAQLRYELARLRDRRTVRAALAVGAWRQEGRAAALAALRGRLPRYDVPGPSVTELRPPFPHLRAAVIGPGAVLAGACAIEHLEPTTALGVVERDRPDLLLVDDVLGWSPVALGDLLRHARERGTRVVTVGTEATAAVRAIATLDLEVTIATDAGPHGAPAPPREIAAGPGGATGPLALPAAVDVRAWSPVGLDDTVPGHRRAGSRHLTVQDARRQPVVVPADAAGPPQDPMHPRRVVELLSAGALVVAPSQPGLAAALAGLPAADRDRLLVPTEGDGPGQRSALREGIEARVAALLADDEQRRRLSVRLRRYVHAQLSTRVAVTRIVEALDLDAPPSERISVLLATRRPERLHQVLTELAAQRHDDVEVVLLVHGDGALPEGLDMPERVRVVERIDASRPLGAVLNRGLDRASGAYVAKADDDDRYGPDHLGDLLLSLHHSGAEVVGRRVHGVFHEDAAVTLHPAAGGEERFEDHLPGATMLLHADTMRRVRWRHVPSAVDTELVRAIHHAGGSAYTGHRYGFVRVRHADHTSRAADAWTGRAVAGFDPGLLEA
jgi:hypothetical protein